MKTLYKHIFYFPMQCFGFKSGSVLYSIGVMDPDQYSEHGSGSRSYNAFKNGFFQLGSFWH